MGGYYRDELEDYDEYEDEVEEQEEEYEEEEDPKPTKEELEYLELRQRLKEVIRKQMKKENGSSLSNRQETKHKLPNDNFGSFFGPAKPVIANRVIQESKSFIENQHLAAKVLNSQHGVNKKSSTPATVGSKPGVPNSVPKVINEQKVKAQKLKNTRDYSFLLSDNAEPQAPAKESINRSSRIPCPEVRSSQVPPKSKQPLGNSGRHVSGGHEQRRPVDSHVHPKTGSSKSSSGSRPSSASMDSRKQLGGKNGIGPGRPLGQTITASKMHVAGLGKKISAPNSNNSLPALHKLPSSKLQSSVPKQQHLEFRKPQQQHMEQRKPQQHLGQRKPQQHLEQRKQQQHLQQRKEIQDPNKSRMTPKLPMASSRPQINKPLKPNPSRTMLDQRPKKKPVRYDSDDEDDPVAAIRKMFGYNPNKYAGRDEDDSDMEANFDDILREEKRSAKIARKEDEEQLRLIEQEEEQERRQALMKKKRKLGQR